MDSGKAFPPYALCATRIAQRFIQATRLVVPITRSQRKTRFGPVAKLWRMEFSPTEFLTLFPARLPLALP